MQRTRSSPSARSSPLTRHPLGSRHIPTLAWAALTVGLMLIGSSPCRALVGDNETPEPRTASWIISPGQAVGPVRFGMSRAEVQAAIGAPTTTVIGWNYPGDAFSVVFRDDKAYSIVCGVGSPSLDSDEVPDYAYRFRARTRGGTGIGSTRDEVKADLGTPSEQRVDEHGAEFLRYREAGLNISLWRGRVYNIVVLSRPAP